MRWFQTPSKKEKSKNQVHPENICHLCGILWETEEDETAIHSGLGVSENHVNARKNVTTNVTGGYTIGALIFTTKIVTKAKQI